MMYTIISSVDYCTVEFIVASSELLQNGFATKVTVPKVATPKTPLLGIIMPSYYYYTGQNFHVFSLDSERIEVPMQQRTQYLETVCQSYKGSKFFSIVSSSTKVHFGDVSRALDDGYFGSMVHLEGPP